LLNRFWQSQTTEIAGKHEGLVLRRDQLDEGLATDERGSRLQRSLERATYVDGDGVAARIALFRDLRQIEILEDSLKFLPDGVGHTGGA
jgi:hypothetical protein